MLQPRPPLPFLLLSAYPLFSRGISCLLDRKNMMGSSDAQYFPSNFETNWGEKNCKCNGKKKTYFRARRETKKTFFFSKTVLLSSRVFFFLQVKSGVILFLSRERQITRKATQEKGKSREKGNSRERQLKRKANQEKSKSREKRKTKQEKREQRRKVSRGKREQIPSFSVVAQSPLPQVFYSTFVASFRLGFSFLFFGNHGAGREKRCRAEGNHDFFLVYFSLRGEKETTCC